MAFDALVDYLRTAGPSTFFGVNAIISAVAIIPGGASGMPCSDGMSVRLIRCIFGCVHLFQMSKVCILEVRCHYCPLCFVCKVR